MSDDVEPDDRRLAAAYGIGTRHAIALAEVLAAICADMRRHIDTDFGGVIGDAIDDSLAAELAVRGVRVYPELDIALCSVLEQLGDQVDATASSLDDQLESELRGRMTDEDYCDGITVTGGRCGNPKSWDGSGRCYLHGGKRWSERDD